MHEVFLSFHQPSDPYVGEYTEEDLKYLAKQVGLARWKRCIYATIPLLAAAHRAVGALNMDAKDIGILCIGQDLSANHTEVFLRRAHEGKPDLINPLNFPHTLSSAVPATLAQVLGAKAFAFLLGDTPSALKEALVAAQDMLKLGLASAVLVAVCAEVAATVQDTSSKIRIPVAKVLGVSLTPHVGAVRFNPCTPELDEKLATMPWQTGPVGFARFLQDLETFARS